MPHNIFIQSIALIALVSFAGSFHAKGRTSILLWQLLSLFFWATHYALLGAWTGAILSSLNGLVTIIFLFKGKNTWLSSSWLLILALLAVTLGTFATWEDYYSLFALFGVMAIILSKWQNDVVKIKYIAVGASTLWIIYDVFVGSWGGVISEIFIITSVTFSFHFLKFWKKN